MQPRKEPGLTPTEGLSPSPKREKRAFRCQFCAKEFLRKEHLQRHERLHTKEKPFRCTVCSEGFNRSDLLVRHNRLFHSNPEASASLDNTPLSVSHTQDMGTSPDSFTLFPLNQGDLPPPPESSVTAPHMPWAESIPAGEFALFNDSIMMPYGSNPSTFSFDQPVLNFSPTLLFDPSGSQPAQIQRPISTSADQPPTNRSRPRLFDEFTSSLPSFESPSSNSSHEPWKITQEIWNHHLAEIQKFTLVLPPNFFLPSRHTMTRYIATYFSGFHRHLPFLHIPTFSPTKCPVELILAMATIGAQSAFDHDNTIMFYTTSLAIVKERIRCRKAEQRDMVFSESTAQPSPAQDSQPECTGNQPLPIAQTLLILMAMATWGNSKAIFNEAVGLQNTITNYIREENLLDPQPPPPQDITWHQWIQAEEFNRTISIIFCFLIFHTIVYDTPPPILNSELKITLPSREAAWEASTEAEWTETRASSPPEQTFQSAFSLLFSPQPTHSPSKTTFSSLGGYTLILALIQHIYLLRETTKHNPPPLPQTSVSEIDQALRNWQTGWYRDPESSLGPGNPKGPISFNSTALLRMAYIRLNVDVGPWRALKTHNPSDIAASMHKAPPLIPNHQLTRAVLYSAHALSIPVKIGVNIVARNQAFAWSLQHSLCALECAFVVSRWLIAIQPRVSQGTLDEEEASVLAYLTDMVAEADSGGEAGLGGRDLCTRVIRVWAKLLSGEAVWDVVRMVGRALDAYGRILEARDGA